MNTPPPKPPEPPKPQTAAPLRAGAGTRLTSTTIGQAIAVPSRGPRLGVAFRPSLNQGGISFSSGYVAGRMPTIGGTPIAPVKGAPPVLKLDPAIVNARGESWVCVEVHPDARGLLPAESAVEIVQRSVPIVHASNLGRLALCLIVFEEKRPVLVHQVVHFNCGYERVLPPEGAGSARHLFP